MQTQFERFPELPQELEVESAHHLPSSRLAHYAQMNKKYHTLFQPLPDARQLVHWVMRGELVKAQAL
ncbi:MAG: hypothetical protein J0I93_13610 [Legionella sp.]|nr:hypothetical protein [Legionella sp.]